jgi:hypothetical protein
MNQQNWFKRSEIHKLFNSIWNEEELPDQSKKSITVPIYNYGNETDYQFSYAIIVINFL